MHVLLINYEFPPIGAGAATATEAMARRLHDCGHRVSILTTAYGDSLPKEVKDAYTIYRVRSRRRRLDHSNIVEMGSFMLAAGFRLLPMGQREGIDASIAFFSIPGGPVALLGKYCFGIPYVVSLRGGDVPGTEPHLKWIHAALSPLRRAIFSNALAVVANSEGLKRLAEEADGFSVRVICNGVDTDTFKPVADASPREEPFRFLFVGRFQKQKNLSFLLQEFAGLKSENAPAFDIHMVGDGPLREELEKEATALMLDVKWHGWQPREKLVGIYQASNCLVNPSHYEGMPNVLLEGMACGLPVVASDVPGNDALVKDGETGFLVKPGDRQGMRKALRKVLEEPAMACDMGIRAREITEHQYSWSTVAESYARIFDEEG